MGDAVRMMDLAGLTRSLDEFRRLDPEHRAAAERLADRAAQRHLDRVHEDVARAEGAAETQGEVRERGRDDRRRRQTPEPPEGSAPEKDASPEREEGLLLDIKV